MLLEILIFLLLGTLAGIFTGLMPGIHINLVGSLIVGFSASIFAGIDALFFAVFIVSMSITHVFIDFIPSIFLGAPEEGTELSVLPGHELLSQGSGLEAVGITSLGCLLGIFIFVVSIIPLYFFAQNIKNLIFFQKAIPFFLIAISLNLIFIERSKVKAFFVFLISGILGLIVLNLPLKEPLLPLLTGLFGASGIILSLDSKIDFGKQKKKFKLKIKKFKPLLAAAIFSPLSIFLPALSGGQIATIGNQFVKLDKRGFLFLLGIINSLGMAFSFLAFFLIGKTRTGSAVAVQSLLGAIDIKIFSLLVLVIVFSGILSFVISKKLSQKFITILAKFEYRKISVAVLAIVSIITLFVSGFFGLVVLSVSTATGIYCIKQGTSRIAMMGCLLVPTMILYLVP